MKAPTEVREAIRGWILKTNRKITAAQLTDSTPILERRIVTSLQLLDFILFLEELRGSPIDVTQVPKGTFRSVDSIYDHFFGGATHGRA